MSTNKTVSAAFAAATTTSGTDASPYVNVAAVVYGRNPSYSTSECTQIADDFDVVLNAMDCRQTIKSVNPKTIVLAYTNSSNCTAGDDLCTYLQSLSNPENYFLDSTVNGSVQNIDGSVFTRNIGQRICAYSGSCADGGSGSRWQTDYTVDASRSVIAGFFSNVAAHLPANTDGWFFDNMDRGCGYGGNLTSGQIAHGITAPFSFSSGQPMEDNCNALRQAMNAAMPANIYTVDNISNYGITSCGGYGWQRCTNQLGGVTLSHNYAQAVLTTRGVLQEFEYRFSTLLPEFQANYGGLNEIWQAKGKPSNSLYIMWWVSSGSGTGIADNSDRIKLYALGTHLIFQFDRSYMRYDGLNSNNSPLTGDWFGAMGAPLGLPSGNSYTVDGGRTYRRDFQNAIVLDRFRLTSSDNYTDTATYSLGGTYYPVNADGTYGSPISSVTLQNAQVFIGIKDPAFK